MARGVHGEAGTGELSLALQGEREPDKSGSRLYHFMGGVLSRPRLKRDSEHLATALAFVKQIDHQPRFWPRH